MAVEHTQVTMANGVQFVARDVVSGDLDGNGVLTLVYNGVDDSTAARPWLRLEEGLVLAGIKFVQGSPPTDTTARLGGQLLVITAAGAGALLLHEDAGVTASHRFKVTPSSVDLGVDSRQLLFLYDGTAQRWSLPDWSYMTVGNASHWAGSPPATVAAAIDRLAAQVYALGSNTAIP
jgi:hypothetical protein